MYSNEKIEVINVAYNYDMNNISKYKNSRSALNIWINSFTKNINKNINMNVYDNNEEIINDYINSKIDAISINADVYLKNKEKLDKNTVEYWHLRRSEIKPYQKMYLIVNRNSNINTVLDLKNKKIAIDTHNEFGKIFFEKTFISSTQKNADNIMSKINYNKSSSLLLKTYFSKYDAAVITSYEYKIMIDLNPAIKKRIKILKSSPEIFPYTFVLFHKKNKINNIQIFRKMLKKFLQSKNKEELYNIVKIKEISINKKDDFYLLGKYYEDYLEIKNKFDK